MTSRLTARSFAAAVAGLALAGVGLLDAAPPAPPQQPAGSGLLVAPTRLVFEGRQRNAELVLVNRGPERSTYRISFTQMEMDETGAIREVAEADDSGRGADRLVRYSPRQVTLEPNETQTVRLQVRKPADLAPGEYRSHLLLRYVPPPEVAAPGGPAAQRGLEVRLIPIYGVSLPVIVRHGETAAEVIVQGTELTTAPETGDAELHLTLQRSGNRSVYGDLSVLHTGSDGEVRTLASMRGLAVYTPNEARRVRLPLGVDLESLRGGLVEILYEDAEQGGETLASARFRLP